MGRNAENISQSSLWRFDLLMIFVMLGTQNNSFQRLLEEIDKLINQNVIHEEVVVQAGYTQYQPKCEEMKIIDFMPREELDTYEQNANFIITHGGVGSIITSLEKGKKVIAVPRLHQYGEHVNNHQTEIVEKFNKGGNIIGLQSVEELEEAIKKVQDFEPKPYIENNKKMLEIIENFIDNVK